MLAFAASNFSFPEGTEVLTPEGPVAIESLREGDLVIARNEETGVSGVFPVTAVMGRQASEVLWLTLESETGEVTRMGVTPTHPLFIVEMGWGEASKLVPGDAIRDKDLQALTVLAVEVDTRPQMVHNLEIADAHTYFAGELEAWGHNGRKGYIAAMLMHIFTACVDNSGPEPSITDVLGGELDPDGIERGDKFGGRKGPRRIKQGSCPILPRGPGKGPIFPIRFD